jgi:asparagine synthase (glutamine-hydrolysing)
MCGLFGILTHGSDDYVDEGKLVCTARLLEHRGPDHQAVFSGHGIGLAQTRLALVDLDARSNQPFWDREGRRCIVFNGEVYNFRELRADLEAQGIAFRTTSDTEVILEAVIHDGIDVTLPRLEGMFAFAIFDAVDQSLTLARDRFGIKPLYVHEGKDAFVFTSEIRALTPWLRLEPDAFAISSYLQGDCGPCSLQIYGGPTAGPSFFKGITIVPPGVVLTIRRGAAPCSRRFWTIGDFWDPDEHDRLRTIKPSQTVDRLDEYLFRSVKLQLLADAPVGVLCSGGIDSSLITAMAARVRNNVAIFHAHVVGPSSELDAARAVAQHLKLDLQIADVEEEATIDLLPEVLLHYGSPFTYHPNSIPFLAVSKLVRTHGVKAVLSGEGADECFIGYPWMIFDIRERVLGASASLRDIYRMLRRVLKHLSAQDGLGRPTLDTLALTMSLQRRFEIALDEADIQTAVAAKGGRGFGVNELKSLSKLGYHLRTLLHRNDSLGMAASIEARFPFLDSAVVRLAVNMPYDTKVRFSPAVVNGPHLFLRDKWALRKVAERYLPKSLAYRRKQGFHPHSTARLDIDLTFARDSFIAALFSLGPKQVDYLTSQAGPATQMKLLQLEVWARLFLFGATTADVQAWLQRVVRWHISAPSSSTQ